MANKRISELPPASTPLIGSELLEGVQGGQNVQMTSQDVADLAVAASVPDADATTKGIAKLFTTTDGTGTDGAPSQSAVNSKFRLTRTVTGTDSIVQTNDNSFIIFNSATPFNFTLDQLTANTKFTFMNIGAGAVTFLAGSGVTMSGFTIVSAAAGNAFPTGAVFYHTATTPRIIMDVRDESLNAVTISAGTLTLNMNSATIKLFDLTATVSSAFTIAFSNDTAMIRATLSLRVTGTVAITMPSAVVMGDEEVASGRWVVATNILTIIGVTASVFIIDFYKDASGNVLCFASEKMA